MATQTTTVSANSIPEIPSAEQLIKNRQHALDFRASEFQALASEDASRKDESDTFLATVGYIFEEIRTLFANGEEEGALQMLKVCTGVIDEAIASKRFQKVQEYNPTKMTVADPERLEKANSEPLTEKEKATLEICLRNIGLGKWVLVRSIDVPYNNTLYSGSSDGSLDLDINDHVIRALLRNQCCGIRSSEQRGCDCACSARFSGVIQEELARRKLY